MKFIHVIEYYRDSKLVLTESISSDCSSVHESETAHMRDKADHVYVITYKIMKEVKQAV